MISGNVIYHVMEVRSDGGPIYTNGPQGTSLDHGLTIKGNVTFANKATSFANYNDEGSAYITMDGNVQYKDSGNFNGGCSTTGHIVVKNSYRVGPLNVYICDNVGTDFVDGGGNVLIPQGPAPGDIPASVLGGAGLPAGYSALTTRRPPAVAVVSPIQNHQVLISGSGFTASSTVSVDGQASPSVSFISSNQLAAAVPAGVGEGDVTVSTPAGTSASTVDTYTYDPSLDIAVGHPASQSSTAFGAPASNAVDGNTDGSYFHNSISHTDYNVNAWWQVDLGDVRQLRAINVYNRTDCCADRLTDYWVFVSANPFDTSLTPEQQAAQPGVWSNHQTGTAATPTRIPASTSGRYVMVQLAGTNYLALAEVQVFGTS